MFKTTDLGESCCSLNVSEMGKRLEASSESPGASHLCKLSLIPHLQVPQRDTEKGCSDPLGPGPVLSQKSRGPRAVKTMGPSHFTGLHSSLPLAARSPRGGG